VQQVYKPTFDTPTTLIPTLDAARFDARGELRLAEQLKDCLEDNAWVWHSIPVGPLRGFQEQTVLRRHALAYQLH
jgi:hypothetical protein